MITTTPATISTLRTIEIACGELVEQAQVWSDERFDNQYREAISILVEGFALLVGYVAGYLYSWLKLQVARTICYWLGEVTQSVLVMNDWWSAPFVVVEPIAYPEYYWQMLDVEIAVEADILNYELSYAEGAEEVLSAL